MQRMDVYQRIPRIGQTLLCNLHGIRLERLRYGAGFRGIFSSLVDRGTWSNDRLISFRNDRLRSFVNRACTIPFYRDRFLQAGIDPQKIRSLEDLSSLPVLTKPEARDRIEELRSTACQETGYLSETGGTTGTGLHFFETRKAIQEQWGVWWRYRGWHGIDRQTWCGYFSARAVCAPWQQRPPFWRVSYASRQIFFSAQHLTDANLAFCISEMRRRRVPWLHGFPTLLATVASYIVDRGIDLGYPIRAVTIGSENLTDNQIAVMKCAFGVSPLQSYGMAEGIANFSQCERGNLHIDEDYAAVELAPTEEDGVFRILGTNLSNPMTPFIRYDVGDFVTAGAGSCGCGRPGRVVGRIHGRVSDYLTLRNGRRFGPANVLFSKMTNVRAAQIVQAAEGNLVFSIVRAPGFTEDDERHLRLEIRRRLGAADATTRVEYVTELRKTAGGKTPVVISL